jgi:hypothetical protein
MRRLIADLSAADLEVIAHRGQERAGGRTICDAGRKFLSAHVRYESGIVGVGVGCHLDLRHECFLSQGLRLAEPFAVAALPIAVVEPTLLAGLVPGVVDGVHPARRHFPAVAYQAVLVSEIA